MSTEKPKIVPICGNCGVTGVRIYRDYGMFRRPEEDRCNNCFSTVPSWMVPCILDENGNAWGYTSVPHEDCLKFYALPEQAPHKPSWDPKTGTWTKV